MFPPTDEQPDPVALLSNALRAESGPGDVGPSVNGIADPATLVTLPLTVEEIGEWWKRIERSRKRREEREKTWDALLKEYQPIVTPSGTAEEIKVNGHFRNVHTKIGQLFYRSPELQLTPEGVTTDLVPQIDPRTGQPAIDPMTGQPITMTAEQVVTVKQAVLNKKLGRDGLKASRLMDELLFDVLQWSGFGVSKLGYRVITKPMQEPVMAPAQASPMEAPVVAGNPAGAVPQPQPLMGTDGQPVMRTVDVPVFEEWYWRRFSPKAALFDDVLRSTRYDEDGRWIGGEYFMAPRDIVKAFGVSEAEVGQGTENDRIYKYPEDANSNGSPRLVKVIEIFLKASHFTDEAHPQVIYQLILIDGIKDRPVVYRPSTDQTIDARGQLTHDSLIGFPIRVLTIRDLADSPFPQADAAFVNGSMKERSTHRRQAIRMRDAAIPKLLVDTDQFEDIEQDQIRNGQLGDQIPVKPGALRAGVKSIIDSTPQVHFTQDDWRTEEMLKRDEDQCIGISNNSSGVTEDTVRSATETAAVQSAVAGRSEKERNRCIDFFLDGARMLDALLMRYATEDDYVAIVGEDGARTLQQWNNTLLKAAPKCAYEITPDSQLRVDTAQDRQQLMQYYNIVAMDPLANRAYLQRQMARQFGLDPSKAILSPAALALQPPHGGAAQQGSQVNQHLAGKSGGRENAPGQPNHRDEQLH